VLALDGELVDRQRAFAINHPLGDFIAALSGMTLRPLSAIAKNRLDLMADEIRRVSFEMPEEFEEVVFHPLGLPGPKRWPFGGRIERLFVVAPFVAEGCLRRLGKA